MSQESPSRSEGTDAISDAALELKTNCDDWRELVFRMDDHSIVYSGHDVPQSVWLEILEAAGVAVEVIIDGFGYEPAC